MLIFIVFFLAHCEISLHGHESVLEGHKCVQDSLKHDIGSIDDVPRRQVTELVPLNIHFDTSHLRDDLSRELYFNRYDFDVDEVFDFLEKEVFSYAKKVIKDIFYVWNTRSYIQFHSAKPDFSCHGVSLPDKYRLHSMEHFGGDLLILSSMKDTAHCKAAVAYGGRLGKDGRPVLGILNLCPKMLSYYDNLQNPFFEDIYDFLHLNELKKIIVHEIFHVLGFNVAFFQSAIRRKIINGHNVTFFDTPRAREEVQKHFDCPSVQGIELENYFSAASSHLESRLFYSELMMGFVYPELRTSALSLSILESLGFYLIDYSKAEILNFGHKAGCEFAQGPCIIKDEKTKKIRVNGPRYGHYCIQKNHTSCLISHSGIGHCNVQSWISGLEDWERYFPGEPRKGGGKYMVDGCPMYTPYDYCKVGLKCVNEKRLGGVCKPIKCTENNLKFEFEGETVTCEVGDEGRSMRDGKVFCPPHERVCREFLDGRVESLYEDKGLNRTKIVLIFVIVVLVIGILSCVVFLVLLGGFYFLKKKRNVQEEDDDKDENSSIGTESSSIGTEGDSSFGISTELTSDFDTSDV